jgi:hypothetical protein
VQFGIDSNPVKRGQSSGMASRLIVAAMSDIRPVAAATDDLPPRFEPWLTCRARVAGILMRV